MASPHAHTRRPAWSQERVYWQVKQTDGVDVLCVRGPVIVAAGAPQGRKKKISNKLGKLHALARARG